MTYYSLLSSDGTDGFQMRYKNGSSLDKCNSTETLMFFHCDQNAQWDVKNPNITGYISNDLRDDCYVRYLFLYH